MSLKLGLGHGLQRGGVAGIALGRVLNLDWATGAGYGQLAVTSNSAIGLVKGHDGLWVAKPAGYLAGLEGARVNGSAPAWDDGLGNALSGVIWRGPAPAATNLCLHSRDLTNAVWTKTNATAAKTATGIDGVANSASTLTATAGNATCLQSITSGSSARRQSVFVKRRAGSGVVQMTQDGGTTWTAVTVTASWARVDIPSQTLANPSVGFRIVTSGDAVDIDVTQQEVGTSVTPPIATTTTAQNRLAETVGIAFSDPPEWTAFAAFKAKAHSPAPSGIVFCAGAFPYAGLSYNLASEGKLSFIHNNNPNNVLASINYPTAGATVKIKVRFKSGQLSICDEAGNITNVSVTTNANISPEFFYLGSKESTFGSYDEEIKTVAVWTRWLSDAELLNA